MKEETHGVIFKIVNKKNGMTYVGATKLKLNKIRALYQNAYKSKKKTMFIHKILATEGSENFEWSILEEVSTREELFQRKKLHIENYRKAGISYNEKRRLVPESVTKTVAQYSLEGELLKEYASTKIASQSLGILASSIKSCCNNNCSTLKGFVFVYPEDFQTTSELREEIERRLAIKKTV